MLVINATTGSTLAGRAESASTPWAQFKGLMGRTTLPPDCGLVLPRTRGVHTHFMRFPIDVAFFDKAGVIVGLEHALPPWRFSAYHWRAAGAVELPAGLLYASGTLPGHSLTFSTSGPPMTTTLPLHLHDSRSTVIGNSNRRQELAATDSSNSIRWRVRKS
jgi:uncharacterized membrane protein (UPF0127 family)